MAENRRKIAEFFADTPQAREARVKALLGVLKVDIAYCIANPDNFVHAQTALGVLASLPITRDLDEEFEIFKLLVQWL